MRNSILTVALAGLAGIFFSGCANTTENIERKFSRGLNNSFEVVRIGEVRRSIEQTGVFHGHDAAMSSGFITGVNRSLARTGMGIWEMITAPFPPYDPQRTAYLAPSPVYPDNYTPGPLADSTFETDTNLGFAGGDIIPIIPGSRFRIFDHH
jgi:putative exosortase-associated protein (TIGR04073 family)